jgi:hypothetical protein
MFPEETKRPRAVDARGLEELSGQIVEKALDEDDAECARAGREPDRPVGVDEAVVDDRRTDDLDVQRHEQHDYRHEERRQEQRGDDTGVARAQDREGIAAGHRDQDLNEPRTCRQDDRVPEVARNVDVHPRTGEVAPRKAVREDRHRAADRVVRRCDRRLGEPEQRTEPDHDETDEQKHLRAADAEPHARSAPLGGRDQAGGAVVAHSVLQERVARR